MFLCANWKMYINVKESTELAEALSALPVPEDQKSHFEGRLTSFGNLPTYCPGGQDKNNAFQGLGASWDAYPEIENKKMWNHYDALLNDQ